MRDMMLLFVFDTDTPTGEMTQDWTCLFGVSAAGLEGAQSEHSGYTCADTGFDAPP